MKKRFSSQMKASHRLLYKTISDLSQRHYCSGWRMGVEFEVWEALQSAEPNDFDSELLEEALWLSKKSDGWISWSESARGAQFFALSEWLALYDIYKSKAGHFNTTK